MNLFTFYCCALSARMMGVKKSQIELSKKYTNSNLLLSCASHLFCVMLYCAFIGPDSLHSQLAPFTDFSSSFLICFSSLIQLAHPQADRNALIHETLPNPPMASRACCPQIARQKPACCIPHPNSIFSLRFFHSKASLYFRLRFQFRNTYILLPAF